MNQMNKERVRVSRYTSTFAEFEQAVYEELINKPNYFTPEEAMDIINYYELPTYYKFCASAEEVAEFIVHKEASYRTGY